MGRAQISEDFQDSRMFEFSLALCVLHLVNDYLMCCSVMKSNGKTAPMLCEELESAAVGEASVQSAEIRSAHRRVASHVWKWRMRVRHISLLNSALRFQFGPSGVADTCVWRAEKNN